MERLEREERDSDCCASEWIDSGRRTLQHRESGAGKLQGSAFVRVLVAYYIALLRSTYDIVRASRASLQERSRQMIRT